MPVGVRLRFCPLPGRVPIAGTISLGIGRTVLLALLGVRVAKESPLWCEECQRYFNPAAPHECRDREINANRATLEKWLGTYTIKEG